MCHHTQVHTVYACRDAFGNTAMHYSQRLPELQQRLINAGGLTTTTNCRGEVPAFEAITMQGISEQGLTARDQQGKTLLHACFDDEHELDDGFDFNASVLSNEHFAAQDYCGRTALHLAVGNCEFDEPQLVHRAADVNVRDNLGFTPLHALMAYGRPGDFKSRTFEALVGCCDVNLLLPDGRSAVHLAAASDQDVPLYAIQRLIDLGARYGWRLPVFVSYSTGIKSCNAAWVTTCIAAELTLSTSIATPL